MHTVQRRVGRLVEIRMGLPLTFAEAVIFAEELKAIVKPMADRFVGVCDFTRVSIFPQEVISTYTDCMRSLNPKVERTGVLISNSATFGMQIGRLIRGASSPNRRTFVNPTELCLWLSEVLTPAETARVKEFLAGA
jgi:hypothetical protein